MPLAFLALAGCATHSSQSPDRLIASVQHSEWAEANRLRLDLETGAYSIAPGRWTSTKRRGQRRGRRVVGALSPETLAPLRAAFDAVAGSELVNAQCLATPRKDRGRIIISNGGEKTLNLQSGGRWQRADGELECRRKEALA